MERFGVGKLFVVSLGGSIVVPKEIDWKYLKAFKELILEQINKGNRFAIIVGGGKVARKYQDAAREIGELAPEDLDWLGIHTTRLNAHLLRTIFRKYAHKRVIKNPKEKADFKEKVLVAAGWRPGCSTDYDAVLLAENLGVNTIINITNVSYVYDKEPTKNPDARPLTRISWKDFRKMVGGTWDPGLNVPFDPIASKEAQRAGIKVIIVGKDLNNLQNFFEGKEFVGTIIQ